MYKIKNNNKINNNPLKKINNKNYKILKKNKKLK